MDAEDRPARSKETEDSTPSVGLTFLFGFFRQIKKKLEEAEEAALQQDEQACGGAGTGLPPKGGGREAARSDC
eukprot:CAMPEP_0171548550 /NCGR_PEP_ID=MMETSP0960-20121227/5902_1 /TAXON_ID=87120 /ORGANISM="Aurantiochytrium limacinum, Strain ATCCMYA-1381" /LENGTH=72 /DNA_ID=CAMNT_0012097049 /DNA_START=203 /DNA_END=422 /DNA_ORIENTATION=-